MGYVDPSGHVCEEKYSAIEEIKKREGCSSKDALEKYRKLKDSNPDLSPEQIKNKYINDNYPDINSRLPRSNGHWEENPGNGIWYSDNPLVNAITGGEGVRFKNGRADFSKWSKGLLKFDEGVLNGTKKDFNKVYAKMKKVYGFMMM